MDGAADGAAATFGYAPLLLIGHWAWKHAHTILPCLFLVSLALASYGAAPLGRIVDDPGSRVRAISQEKQLDWLVRDCKGKKLIMLEVYSHASRACHRSAPVLSAWSQRYSDTSVLFARIDGDSYPDLARRLRVDMVSDTPAYLFFKDGTEVHRMDGLDQKAAQAFLARSGARVERRQR